MFSPESLRAVFECVEQYARRDALHESREQIVLVFVVQNGSPQVEDQTGLVERVGFVGMGVSA